MHDAYIILPNMGSRRELGKTANLLGALAVLVHDRVTVALTEELGRTATAPAAIIALGTRPHRRIDALRATMGLSHSATVRQVDGLVEMGLVDRHPGDDGRSTSLTLTAAGRRIFKRLLARRREVLETFLEQLPDGVYEAMRRTLPAVVHGVADTREEARRICRLCHHEICQPCPIGRSVPCGVPTPA